MVNGRVWTQNTAILYGKEKKENILFNFVNINNKNNKENNNEHIMFYLKFIYVIMRQIYK